MDGSSKDIHIKEGLPTISTKQHTNKHIERHPHMSNKFKKNTKTNSRDIQINKKPCDKRYQGQNITRNRKNTTYMSTINTQRQTMIKILKKATTNKNMTQITLNTHSNTTKLYKHIPKGKQNTKTH